jgi:hypothetical protein
MDLPPPLPDHPVARDGDGWRTVSFITWVSVLICVVVVAVSSRTIGRPVWWLGTSVDPEPRLFTIIPASIIAAPIVIAVKSRRLLRTSGLVCSVLLMATALPDLDDSPGVAAAIVLIAVAALLESIALVVGSRKYR